MAAPPWPLSARAGRCVAHARRPLGRDACYGHREVAVDVEGVAEVIGVQRGDGGAQIVEWVVHAADGAADHRQKAFVGVQVAVSVPVQADEAEVSPQGQNDQQPHDDGHLRPRLSARRGHDGRLVTHFRFVLQTGHTHTLVFSVICCVACRAAPRPSPNRHPFSAQSHVYTQHASQPRSSFD